MKLLILGGTKFLGRHIVEQAVQQGHQVTVFNRGKENPTLFEEQGIEVETIIGDRLAGNLTGLEGRTWDAAIDTSGYIPRVVDNATKLLHDAVRHYTFISTISVYADYKESGITEEYTIAQLDDPTTEEITGQTYGALKALCEATAESNMPGRVLHVRPGLLVGPYDPTDRFTYWPDRIARGGEVLVPGEPNRPVQWIDARDAAAWILHMIEQEQTGIYNVTGPARGDYTMGQFMQECTSAIHTDATIQWVDDSFLDQKVNPWIEMPLWIPDLGSLGFFRISADKAIHTGLSFRPVKDTILDTLRWSEQAQQRERKAGLDPLKEVQLLEDWHRSR